MNEPVVVDGLAALDLAASHDAAAAVCDQTRQRRLLLRSGAVLIAVDLPHPTNLADEGQRVLFTFTGVGIGVPGEPAAKAHCRTGPTRTCSPGPRRVSSSASPSGDAASIPPSLAVTPSVDAAGPA